VPLVVRFIEVHGQDTHESKSKKTLYYIRNRGAHSPLASPTRNTCVELPFLFLSQFCL
jgi:hypothetical protein